MTELAETPRDEELRAKCRHPKRSRFQMWHTGYARFGREYDEWCNRCGAIRTRNMSRFRLPAKGRK